MSSQRQHPDDAFDQHQGPFRYYEPPSSRANPPFTNNVNEPLVPPIDPESKSYRRANLATARHVADTPAKDMSSRQDTLPPSSKRPPLILDPDYTPENVRTTAWSPDAFSPRTRPVQLLPKTRQTSNASQKPRQASNASNTAEALRRGSVPEKSPLQNLESWTKEEKRARVAAAEQKARQKSLAKGEGEPLRQGTLRNDKGRVVSEEAQTRPSRRETQDERPRNVSEPLSPTQPFSTTSRPVRNESTTDRYPARERPAQQAGSQQRQRESEPQRAKAVPTTSASREVGSASTRQGSKDAGKVDNDKYRHRARDAGFAGAALMASSSIPISPNDGAAERGKLAYERRKASVPSPAADYPLSPTSRGNDRAAPGISRGDSTGAQKQSSLSEEVGLHEPVQNNRLANASGRPERQATNVYQQPAPLPREHVQQPPGNPANHPIPPQTAEGQQKVSFRDEQVLQQANGKQKGHHFSDILHGHSEEGRTYQPSSKPLEDWRRAKTARLTLDDLDIERATAAAAAGNGGQQDGAWWEKSQRSNSTTSRRAPPTLPQLDGPYEEKAMAFQPSLFLKCGPLLRYTGIRKEVVLPSRDRPSNEPLERHIWRGSVMIVTEDDSSDLSVTPVLRLFAQPMDLHQAPSSQMLQAGHELPPDVQDPVAGQVKLSRTGRALYVRPVHDIAGGVDLSREENNKGLFSATRSPVLGPQSSTSPNGQISTHITFQDKSRIKKLDGERFGRHRDVKAVRLHTEQGFTFWRFNIEIELASKEHRIAYRINKGPAIGFWVPARGETMNTMFHSCNGFSLSVDSKNFSGPDPLWRDVLNRHQSRPFHVMIGGGDQIYNDAVMRETELFREWLQMKNIEHKHGAEFSLEMQQELEQFYLDRYAMWFSQGLFSMANSQIPMVNLWDDHDIIDGFGSYPHHFMSTKVFCGLGAVAFKYYMLFQHQSLNAETEKDEPSWILGKAPGPYINERSRSIFLSLGNKVKFLGLDCRTERMRDEILSQETYDAVFDRCRAEIAQGETKHLIVLLGVPIAYPRLNFLENVLTSRMMDPIKAIGRSGMLGGFVNKFDGGVEILDDLDDHWTAKHHKAERNWFIQELQELAADKSIRITILGGDVHLGAIGQFYSPKKLGIPKDKDHRYMPNIISSAIVNTPPPPMMADVLNRRNKVHHLDNATDEDMIPMFSHDVDGSRRNNNHLLPRRNFCVIREYVPGSTRPGTPVEERLEPGTPASTTLGASREGDAENAAKDRRFPPGSMKRTMSLTRGPMNLVRRLSGSSKSRNPPVSLAQDQVRPYTAQEQGPPPTGVKRANSLNERGSENGFFASDQGNERPINTFHRRPTDLSIKEARKAAATWEAENNVNGRQPGHIDLEGGLDISLCMEVDQHDPIGTTVPYRLLVPALWYDGPGDANPTSFKSRRGSLLNRLRWNRKRETPAEDQSWSEGSRSRSPSFEDERPSVDRFDATTERNTVANAMYLTTPSHEQAAPQPQPVPYIANRNVAVLGTQNATPRAAPSNGSLPPLTLAPTHAAYSKGYNLSAPPIGIHQQQQDVQPAPSAQRQAQPAVAAPLASNKTPNNPYPQSGYRRASAPVASAGSLTQSEDYSDIDEQPPPVKRGSKAERFFGISDGTAAMAPSRPANVLVKRSNTTGGEADEKKKKAGWKIW